jgi:Topoisomerase DNA binding C4 zinc finger
LPVIDQGLTRISLGELVTLIRSRRPAQPVLDMGCPRSGGALILRQGPHGDFLGCSDYPECDYTERVIG